MFDIRYQYAFHTISFIEQSLSERTLGCFRERCITYDNDTITGLAEEMAALIKVDRSLKEWIA